MKLTTQIIDYMVKEYQELLKNELSVISLTSLLHIDDENAQGYMREVLDIEKIEGKSDIRPLLEKYIGEEKYNFAIMYFTEECEIKSYELGKIDESILELFVERGMLDGLYYKIKSHARFGDMFCIKLEYKWKEYDMTFSVDDSIGHMLFEIEGWFENLIEGE